MLFVFCLDNPIYLVHLDSNSSSRSSRHNARALVLRNGPICMRQPMLTHISNPRRVSDLGALSACDRTHAHRQIRVPVDPRVIRIGQFGVALVSGSRCGST